MKNGWERLKIISIVLIIVLNIYTISQVKQLDENTRNLSLQIYTIEGNISSMYETVTSDITDALEKENSLISDFSYDYNSFKDGKMSLNLKALPKEFSSEATYYFSYLLKDGTTDRIKAKVNDGNYLLANLDLPFKEGIEINYIEEIGSKKRMEKLDYIDSIEEDLTQAFNPEEGPSIMTFGPSEDNLLLDNIYMISYDFDYDSFEDDQGIESAEVYLSLDGDTIASFPMKQKKDISTSVREIYEYHFEDYKLDFKEKDMIQVYALAQHSKGYKVKILLGRIYKDMDQGDNLPEEPWEETVSLVFNE